MEFELEILQSERKQKKLKNLKMFLRRQRNNDFPLFYFSCSHSSQSYYEIDSIVNIYGIQIVEIVDNK